MRRRRDMSPADWKRTGNPAGKRKARKAAALATTNAVISTETPARCRRCPLKSRLARNRPALEDPHGIDIRFDPATRIAGLFELFVKPGNPRRIGSNEDDLVFVFQRMIDQLRDMIFHRVRQPEGQRYERVFHGIGHERREKITLRSIALLPVEKI